MAAQRDPAGMLRTLQELAQREDEPAAKAFAQEVLAAAGDKPETLARVLEEKGRPLTQK